MEAAPPIPAEQKATRLELGLALLAIAGAVDAIGFLRLGHLFVSFMSGNSTQLAVDLTRGDWADARLAALLVVGFLVGVMSGRLTGRIAGPWRRPAILVGEALLLAFAAALAPRAFWGVLPLTLAMGMQNTVLPKAPDAPIGATYVTGTLVHFGEQLMDAILAWQWRWAPYALQWVSLVAGAAFGGFTFLRLGMVALAGTAAAVAAVALILAAAGAEPRGGEAH